MPVVLGFSGQFNAAFFTGSPSATDLVPGVFPVAIAGHPYLLDLSHTSVETITAWFREETLPLLRDQADDSGEPSESSISPDPLWRRAQETWHKGQGQMFFDRTDSDRARYRTSKGVDPWEKWELSLHDVAVLRDSYSGGAGSSIVAVSDRAYTSSGQTDLRTAVDPLTSWTAVTGTPANNCTSLTSDGVNVYSAWGSDRIFITDTVSTPTAATDFVTSGNPVTVVSYLKGRLLAAGANNLYEITATGALPAAFFTHPNASWEWVGFAEGDAFVYAAGNAGDTGGVYKLGISESTAFADASRAESGLPSGETIHAVHGAFGFVFLGTSRGVRFCATTDTGDLQVGALIETGTPVRCFTTWDRFTWFGWDDFDTVSSGLGRLDPTVINDGLAPAYASDLMATVTGSVNSAASVAGYRVFTIDGSGVWVQNEDVPVGGGSLSTGLVSYGIADQKIAAFLDLRHEPLPAGTSIEVTLTSDSATPVSIGTSSAPGSVGPGPLSGQQRRAELSELTFLLGQANDESPVMRRWTLRSLPAPRRVRTWVLPIRLEEALSASFDREFHQDPAAELAFLRDLHATQEVFTLQLSTRSFQAVLSDYTFLKDRLTTEESQPSNVFTGLLTATCVEIAG